MNFSDFLLIAASACQTFVERIEASDQRDRLARLDNLEELLTDLCVRTERRDLEALRLARALDKLQIRLDTRRADLRGLADRLAALEATAAQAAARPSPLVDERALLEAFREALTAEVDDDDDDDPPTRTAAGGETPRARNAARESAAPLTTDAPTSDRAASITGDLDPSAADAPSSHTDPARRGLRTINSGDESAHRAADDCLVEGTTHKTIETPTPTRTDAPSIPLDRSSDADSPTASPSSGSHSGAFLFDLFSASRSATHQAMAILCAAGIPSEEARVWFDSGAWSKPRQRTAAHRKARKLLTEINREYGRHGTAELRRTIDYYTPEATWELFWPGPTNVTPIRRVAEG